MAEKARKVDHSRDDLTDPPNIHAGKKKPSENEYNA